MLTRRSIVVGALALSACAPHEKAPSAPAQPVDDPRFAEIESRIGGRVGVAAWNTGADEWLRHRSQERFALCSTFKWALAAAQLNMAEHGGPQLHDQVRYRAAEVLDYAPVARANLARGWLTIEEACAAAVMVSDNTAANLLLETQFGPEGFTRFLRAHGDAVTRLDRTEPSLNENAPGDERDTTTPDAMARTLRRFIIADQPGSEGILNAANRERLINWMVDSTTGRERLRAGLPSDWRVGDKTGTGVNGAHNDVAVIWPPAQAPIVIASYLSESERSSDELNAVHADIARAVAETWA